MNELAPQPLSIDEIVDDLETLLMEKGLRSKLLHWDLNANPATGILVLDRIQVRDEFEHQGYADEALTILDGYCDEHDLDVELTVRPLDERTDPARLRRLYVRHGYVGVDPRRENVMIRACKRNKKK